MVDKKVIYSKFDTHMLHIHICMSNMLYVVYCIYAYNVVYICICSIVCVMADVMISYCSSMTSASTACEHGGSLGTSQANSMDTDVGC